ncbi:hypothetical protein, variant [Aphanomyces invadans]|uniref:Anaphase-promoting complex subunit 4 WD40 domain-containing protein n=1 Tax=Aphanomyces invadans TaxID=157072 RepID=A0A024UD01_9STRA|nr:hypothetical protein, variant [Aphanomyces invadans]ETW03762.1 hypothetical protein, variant [Aphanomyces invadans]|eukprot:XP_008867991.1 hypothetical protein, variant [Aphanomyces invadans]
MYTVFALVVLVVLGVAGYLFLNRQAVASANEHRGTKGLQPKEHSDMPKPHTKKPHLKHHGPTHHHANSADIAKPKQPHVPDHPLLCHVLKGHTGPITSACFSPNGRFIATASTDRTIRLTLRESLGSKNPTFKTINIPYDYATTCTFSSDGKTLGVVTADGQAVMLYHKFKTKPECLHTFPIHHDVASLLLNDVGDKWMTIVTVGRDDDTVVKCWDVDGALLQSTNIHQIQNFHGMQSKDNRFIAVAAFTPEVKIYEIHRKKGTGAFDKMHKVMALQGHTSGVLDVAFDGSDSTPVNHIVTTSKDGSVRVWDINVRYKLEEDPKCIKTYTSSVVYSTIDVTPNGKLLALGHGQDVTFVRVDSMEVVLSIAHAQEGRLGMSKV